MNELKEKTTARGITLIALVVTIVVLLILAGVSLNLVIGNNGIITKAGETKTAQSHAQVRDAIMLAYGEYQVNMYASSSQQTFLEFLQSKGYTDENGTVNVETLLGKKLNLGNGSNDTDVYKVEEVDDNYELNYYEKDGTKTKLDTIAPVGTGDGKITYTQADIDETLKYFTFDETTGVLTTNEDMIGGYYSKTYPTKVVIPKEINGVKVTSISSSYSSGGFKWYGSFAYSNVKEVVILAEIEAIGGGNINDGAFSNCTELNRIELPDTLTKIDNYTFYGCTSLTRITIPNSVTSIGNYAFAGCTSLTSITIPSSVTSIGNGAFSDCTGLTSITVEEGNTVYDSRNDCNAIIEKSSNKLIAGCKTTIIPNSVTSIGEDAFGGCTSLTSITIPSSVTSIEWGAFNGCTSLQNVYYTGTEEQWNAITIGYVNDSLTDATKTYNYTAE